MSKTNAQVITAFTEGKRANSSNRNLRSEANGEDGDTFLVSYSTTIAIRRAKTEQVFYDAHSYSPTTSQHQGGHYGSPEFSFNCVAELMGTRWYETARITDWGPRTCHDPACEREREQQRCMYLAGITKWYDNIYDRCWASEEERDDSRPNLHALDLPDYGDPKHWATAAVLLEFDRGGQHTQVLCGFERGKNIKWVGRTDQLWAAILPFHVFNIQQAFEALKPAYVRNVERNNELAAQSENGDGHIRAVKRQGDLYFVECLNDGRPPKDAIKMDGVSLPPGERANHRPNQVRLVMGPEVQQFQSAGTPPRGVEWLLWARGNVDHPEHPRLRLGSWHRVLASAAVRGASAAYRNYMGAGGGAGGD